MCDLFWSCLGLPVLRRPKKCSNLIFSPTTTKIRARIRNTHTHTHKHAHKCTHTHARALSHIHERTHTHTNTRARTHARTHAHTHTRKRKKNHLSLKYENENIVSEKVNGKPNRLTKSTNIDPKNNLSFLFHYLNLRRYVFTTSPTDFPLGFCFEETHTRWFLSAKNLIILEMSVKTLVYPDDKLWFFQRCRIAAGLCEWQIDFVTDNACECREVLFV